MARTRDLTGDPAAMRALAHPVRLAVLDLLGQYGPLTATEAGRRLDESPGTMSWHFQVLARHGFVVEDAGAAGRRRPWRLAASGQRLARDPGSAEERVAADALLGTVLDRAVAQLRGWLATRFTAAAEWRQAAALANWTLYLTADETAALREELYDLLGRYDGRAEDPALRPAGALPVQALVALHPVAPTDPR